MTGGGGATRSVIVTGGSSGVGAAFCRAAAREGWHVWIGFDTGADRAARLRDEVETSGGSAACLRLPLDDPMTVRASVAEAARPPAPEALVLCGAPAPDIAPLVKIAPDQLRRQLEVAVVGNHALLAETWRQCFRPRGGGHVVAVLSAALGPPAAPHMAGYVAAKGGLAALLEAAAAELGPAGLRISTLRPGYTETPMLSAFEPRFLERARAVARAGRFLTPEEVASALLACLRDPPPPGAVADRSLPEPVREDSRDRIAVRS